VKTEGTLSPRFVLPLPGWVLHPYTAVVIAAVHVCLSYGHLSILFRGPSRTDFWKGFSALGGAYVFAALATRGFARYKSPLPSFEPVAATRD
jgi:hypothetical protein